MRGHILELGHRDGRFIRAGGVYVFTRRGPDDRTEALYVGEAPVIAGVAGPGHPVWRRAQQMGLSGLLVVLEADPDRRRRFAREMEATLMPVLNGGCVPPGGQPDEGRTVRLDGRTHRPLPCDLGLG